MTKRRSSSQNTSTESVSSLRDVVGDGVYDVWVDMLRALVPDGRTHRLSLLVASMLAYAARMARSDSDSRDEDDPASRLLATSEGMEDEEAFRLLKALLVKLFKDAKVKHERVSSDGEGYSIAREATIEFCRWHNDPWEG